MHWVIGLSFLLFIPASQADEIGELCKAHSPPAVATHTCGHLPIPNRGSTGLSAINLADHKALKDQTLILSLLARGRDAAATQMREMGDDKKPLPSQMTDCAQEASRKLHEARACAASEFDHTRWLDQYSRQNRLGAYKDASSAQEKFRDEKTSADSIQIKPTQSMMGDGTDQLSPEASRSLTERIAAAIDKSRAGATPETDWTKLEGQIRRAHDDIKSKCVQEAKDIATACPIAAFVKGEDIADAEAQFRKHAMKSAGDIVKRELNSLSDANLQLAEALDAQLREQVKKDPSTLCSAYGLLKSRIADFRKTDTSKIKTAVDLAGSIPGLSILSSLTSAGISYFKDRKDAAAGARIHAELSTLTPGSIPRAEELRQQARDAASETGLALASVLLPGSGLTRSTLRAEAAAVRTIAQDIKVTESTVQKALARLNHEAGIATKPAEADARAALALRIEQNCKNLSSFGCRESMARFQRLGEYRPDYKVAAEEATARRTATTGSKLPLHNPVTDSRGIMIARNVEELTATPLGYQMVGQARKTGIGHHGQPIFALTERFTTDGVRLPKGTLFYLDAQKKDHLEVFSSSGVSLYVLNLNGTVNWEKTKAAKGRKLFHHH